MNIITDIFIIKIQKSKDTSKTGSVLFIFTYSTVTDFAKFLGLSTSNPFSLEI